MKKITEVTKRDIYDLFSCGIELPNGETSCISWCGRLEDADFLARLYNLNALPSTDYRYRTAEGDIRCHTGFRDWDDNWVFTDGRFHLMDGDDEIFLRFICEVFHPAVTRHSVEDEFAPEKYFFEQIGTILQTAGYELYETGRLGGKPVFSWREVQVPEVVLRTQTSALRKAFDSVHLQNQIDQMQKSITIDPTDAIGKAKELVESCCKTILEENGVLVDSNWEIPRLIKETTVVLDESLLPQDIANERAEESVKKLIGNLSQLPYRLAELRNEMGTGHGRANSFTGLEARHARMAVGAAATLCWFLWETHEKKKKRG